MKSFYLFVEISGLKQFLAVQDPVVSEFINDCRRIISNLGENRMEIQGSFLIFQIEQRIVSAAAFIEGATAVLETLGRQADDLHEYSIIALEGDSSDYAGIISEVKQDYHSRCVDSALLAGKSILSAAGVGCAGSEIPGYGIFYPNEGRQTRADVLYEELCEPAEVEKIIEFLVPEPGAERSSNGLYLSGASDLVLHCNLNAALGKISSESAFPVISVNRLEGDCGTVMPYFRSIDPDFEKEAGRYLAGVERRTWENLASSGSWNSDYPEQTFFTYYCLYLKAWMKASEASLYPSVMLVEGVGFEDQRSLDFLGRIIDFLSADGDMLIIFFENKDFPLGSDLRKHPVFDGLENASCCSGSIEPQTGDSMKYILKRLLFTVYLTEGLFDRGELEKFLTGFGYDEMEISSGLAELAGAGCISSGRFPYIIKSSICRSLIGEISSRDDIYHAVAGFIRQNLYTGSLDWALAVRRLIPQAGEPVVAEAVFGCLSRMLDYGDTAGVRSRITDNGDISEDFRTALLLRCALIEGNAGECKELMKNAPDTVDLGSDYVTIMLLIEASRYYNAMNDYPKGLEYIKKALIILQEQDLPILEGTAFTELGYIMMCKGKYLESSEYLGLALEKLHGTGDSFNLMKAYYFSALGQYLWGSLDIALDFIGKASETAAGERYYNWYFASEFLKCRLYFQLGRYYDAEKLLSYGLLQNEIFGDSKRRSLFLSWTARACVYQGKVYRGVNILRSLEEGAEVLMFRAEAYFFQGDLEKAVSEIEKIGDGTEYLKSVFLPLENMRWDNGFISVEDRALRSSEGSGVGLHLARAFLAYLYGMSGNKEYGMEILFSLTRDLKISEYDPFNRLYYYFYCALYDKVSDSDNVDKLTLISKALKYLQQTSSRINIPSVRQEFMMKNYWNSRLVNEARNEKLF